MVSRLSASYHFGGNGRAEQAVGKERRATRRLGHWTIYRLLFHWACDRSPWWSALRMEVSLPIVGLCRVARRSVLSHTGVTCTFTFTFTSQDPAPGPGPSCGYPSALAGFSTRKDLLGVTSIVRAGFGRPMIDSSETGSPMEIPGKEGHARWH